MFPTIILIQFNRLSNAKRYPNSDFPLKYRFRPVELFSFHLCRLVSFMESTYFFSFFIFFFVDCKYLPVISACSVRWLCFCACPESTFAFHLLIFLILAVSNCTCDFTDHSHDALLPQTCQMTTSYFVSLFIFTHSSPIKSNSFTRTSLLIHHMFQIEKLINFCKKAFQHLRRKSNWKSHMAQTHDLIALLRDEIV